VVVVIIITLNFINLASDLILYQPFLPFQPFQPFLLSQALDFIHLLTIKYSALAWG